MVRTSDVGGLMGEGFCAVEVDGCVFEGVEEGDIGMDGERVVRDVVAGVGFVMKSIIGVAPQLSRTLCNERTQKCTSKEGLCA